MDLSFIKTEIVLHAVASKQILRIFFCGLSEHEKFAFSSRLFCRSTFIVSYSYMTSLKDLNAFFKEVLNKALRKLKKPDLNSTMRFL